MMIYEKKYFKHTQMTNPFDKNNIAQLYFILGRAKLCWKFSSALTDALDIYKYPAVHMVNTHFPLENL